MTGYYLYCPKCQYENINFIREPRQKSNAINTRGGYGAPIQYVDCPYCKYIYAGSMRYSMGDADEPAYYKGSIQMNDKYMGDNKGD